MNIVRRRVTAALTCVFIAGAALTTFFSSSASATRPRCQRCAPITTCSTTTTSSTTTSTIPSSTSTSFTTTSSTTTTIAPPTNFIVVEGDNVEVHEHDETVREVVERQVIVAAPPAVAVRATPTFTG